MMTLSTSDIRDRDYEDVAIASVDEKDEDGWSFKRADGWSFYCPDVGIVPHVDDIARFYGKGVGYTIRGLAINGQVVFYKTEEQERAEYQQEQQDKTAKQRTDYAEKAAGYERIIRDLPPVFQRRIERFRRTNPDFNWQHLPYELSCCVDAVKIALHCKTPDEVMTFAKLSWERQFGQIPDLFDGHSGNSWAFACRLAHHYLTDPMWVVQEHGAISLLIGCGKFGCMPGEGLVGEDLEFYEKIKESKGG